MLREDLLGARETAGPRAIGAAGLGDRPKQAGFDRRGFGVHVMAVQAQAGFQTQRVAGAKTDGLNLWFGEQGAGEFFRFGGRYRDFETVFTGVARTADKALNAQQRHTVELHEGHLRHVRRKTRQHRDGCRTLQGEQGALFEQRRNGALIADVFLQMREILILARGVDHQEQLVIAQIGNHQVVEDAAAFVGEHRITLHAHRQVDDVHRHQGFQGFGRIGTGQTNLAHVRDVEQPRLFAGVLVFFHHPERILHGHVVAGERQLVTFG